MEVNKPMSRIWILREEADGFSGPPVMWDRYPECRTQLVVTMSGELKPRTFTILSINNEVHSMDPNLTATQYWNDYFNSGHNTDNFDEWNW
jgi:hypothetical protein